MGRYFGRIVAWEQPPAGKIWRAFFDDGHKVYFHEDDIAEIADVSGQLPSVPLLVETNWMGRVKRWVAETPAADEAQQAEMEPLARYSPPEWDTLYMAPFWVLAAIGLVDGALQPTELGALFRHMVNAEASPSLVGKAIFSELARNYEERQSRFFEDRRSVEDGLKETGQLIDRLDKDEALSLRTHLFVLAGDVAAAHGPMTDTEKAAVVHVTVLIGLTDPE